jgi:hypothetical protein
VVSRPWLIDTVEVSLMALMAPLDATDAGAWPTVRFFVNKLPVVKPRANPVAIPVAVCDAKPVCDAEARDAPRWLMPALPTAWASVRVVVDVDTPCTGVEIRAVAKLALCAIGWLDGEIGVERANAWTGAGSTDLPDVAEAASLDAAAVVAEAVLLSEEVGVEAGVEVAETAGVAAVDEADCAAVATPDRDGVAGVVRSRLVSCLSGW